MRERGRCNDQVVRANHLTLPTQVREELRMATCRG
jgi:hypothetical protein